MPFNIIEIESDENGLIQNGILKGKIISRILVNNLILESGKHFTKGSGSDTVAPIPPTTFQSSQEHLIIFKA